MTQEALLMVGGADPRVGDAGREVVVPVQAAVRVAVPRSSVRGAAHCVNDASPELARLRRSATHGAVFSTLCVTMGSMSQSGAWIVPRRISVLVVLRSHVIDLRRATFVHPVTSITVGAVLGRVRVLLPPGVFVSNSSGSCSAGACGKDRMRGASMGAGGTPIALDATPKLTPTPGAPIVEFLSMAVIGATPVYIDALVDPCVNIYVE